MIPLSCLLVRLTGTGPVLIDSGFGNEATFGGRPMRSVRHLTELLAAAGFAPDDIDVVLISQIHPDQVTGLHRNDGTKTYPNATCYVGARKLAFWSQEPLDLSQLASPPHIKIGMEHAATRMLGFASRSRGVSIETPDVHNTMDMDPDRAVRTRHELIAMLCELG